MTLSEVGTTRRPEPPDGKKELLGFAALTVAAYILGVVALAIVFRVSP